MCCFRDKSTSLDVFHSQITAKEMYPKNSTVVEQLLLDMASMPIVKVGKSREQIKLIDVYNFY